MRLRRCRYTGVSRIHSSLVSQCTWQKEPPEDFAKQTSKQSLHADHHMLVKYSTTNTTALRNDWIRCNEWPLYFPSVGLYYTSLLYRAFCLHPVNLISNIQLPYFIPIFRIRSAQEPSSTGKYYFYCLLSFKCALFCCVIVHTQILVFRSWFDIYIVIKFTVLVIIVWMKTNAMVTTK